MYQKGNKELSIISLFMAGYKLRLYLRQISRLSGLPLKSCQNALAELEKSKILKSNVEGKNKYFSLNLDNIGTKSYLLHAEIYATDRFLDAYPQFKTFMKSLDSNVPIIIFGSFAKFKAEKLSDLDLMIISDKEQKLPYHLLANRVHKVVLSEHSFMRALREQETLVREIEENHIILNNHSFYVNAMWDYYGKQAA